MPAYQPSTPELQVTPYSKQHRFETVSLTRLSSWRLRERILAAAAKDRASNDAGMPATAKLAMLEEVMSTLRK
jgi:hypothetical protein